MNRKGSFPSFVMKEEYFNGAINDMAKDTFSSRSGNYYNVAMASPAVMFATDSKHQMRRVVQKCI